MRLTWPHQLYPQLTASEPHTVHSTQTRIKGGELWRSGAARVSGSVVHILERVVKAYAKETSVYIIYVPAEIVRLKILILPVEEQNKNRSTLQNELFRFPHLRFSDFAVAASVPICSYN